MADWGVFAVARDIWDHPRLSGEPFTRREAWMWLISASAWKPIRVGHRSGVANLERGEFCFSLRFLAGKWQWLIGRVERFILMLENQDMIRDASRDGAKIYSIINYNKFQIVGLPKRDAKQEEVETLPRRSRDKEETFKHSNIEESLLSDLQSDPLPLVGPKLKGKPRYSRDFEEFWKAYPTDRNMAKIEAFKQWAKLSDDDRRAAIAAVPAYKTWASKQRDYRTLHAVRFLSQRRFDGFAPPPGIVLSIEDKRIRDAELAENSKWEAELEAARIRQGA